MEDRMPTIERSIDVHVPVQTAYDQWRQFARLPQFMEGVKQVEGFNDNPWQWTAEIARQDEEWEVKILGRIAAQRLAESNRDGGISEGLVIFQPVSDIMSKVLLQLPYSSEDDVQNAAGLEVVSSRMQGELERFKAFVESCCQESGTPIDSLPYQAFP
jgi:uncharacterized membrane protein